MYSQYLGLCTAGHCYVVLAVFKILYCEYCHTRSILGFDTLEYCCTWKYFGVRYSGILQHCLYLKYLGILYCLYFEYSQYFGIQYL